MNSIGMYKNQYNNKYVEPYGYAFYINGDNQRRRIWTSITEKTSEDRRLAKS